MQAQFLHQFALAVDAVQITNQQNAQHSSQSCSLDFWLRVPQVIVFPRGQVVRRNAEKPNTMLSPEVASEVCLRTGSQAYEPYWLRARCFLFLWY
jgi:hypothetical protein